MKVNKNLINLVLILSSLILVVSTLHAETYFSPSTIKYFSCSKVSIINNRATFFLSQEKVNSSSRLLLLEEMKLKLKSLSVGDYSILCISDSSIEMSNLRKKILVGKALAQGFIVREVH